MNLNAQMDIERADGPLARAFERELKRHHGRKGATEIALGYTRGHFRRLFRQKLPIKLDLVLRALDLLGVDPRGFFARAYDIGLHPEHLLSLHTRPDRVEAQLRKIEKTLHRLETEDPPTAEPLQTRDYRPRLETYWRDDASYQRKYLGTTMMFRQPAFVADYLERLDALRYERPKDAAKVAAGVVTILLPLVSADREQILAFACKAIGVYASGHRQSLGFETAAAALLVGLRLAGHHGLELERAELMQRGAYVLSDHGEFDRALLLLKEAQIIYYDKKRSVEIGKLLTCRAMVHSYKEEHKKSIELYMDALELLPTIDRWCERFHFAAYNGIAIGYQELGRLDVAEQWFEEVIGDIEDAEDSTSGKLRWRLGTISYAKGDHRKAEEVLTQSQEILARTDNPITVALVSVDLATALLAQHKLEEACQLAKGTAYLLEHFRHNEIAEAAFFGFLRGGIEGRLTRNLTQRVSEEIRRAYPQLSTPLPRLSRP